MPQRFSGRAACKLHKAFGVMSEIVMWLCDCVTPKVRQVVVRGDGALKQSVLFHQGFLRHLFGTGPCSLSNIAWAICAMAGSLRKERATKTNQLATRTRWSVGCVN